MVKPRVSVLMYVYNNDKYIQEAINSILMQTYKNFEFIIINDFSSDNCKNIILSYKDSRVKLIDNQCYLGLSVSIKKALSYISSDYIAFMDCNCISLSSRLEKQVNYMDNYPMCDVVFVKSSFIDEYGHVNGLLADDDHVDTFEDICKYIPKFNCIIFSGVMLRTRIALHYFNKLIELRFYTLWLVLCDDKIIINKINDFLIISRIHPISNIAIKSDKSHSGWNYIKYIKKFYRVNYNFYPKSSILLNTVYPELDSIKAKLNFLKIRFTSDYTLNIFRFSVFFYLLFDIISLSSKRFLDFFMVLFKKLFINIGRLFGLICPIKNNSDLFFFFPSYHIGGADKVHLDIVKCISDQNPWIFITNRSKNNAFRDFLTQCGKLIDLSLFLGNNKILSHIVTRIIIGFVITIINRSKRPVIFGSLTILLYELIPFIKNNAVFIDLIHATGGGIEYLTLPYIERINKRVFINNNVMEDVNYIYKFVGLSTNVTEINLIIENQVEIPIEYPEKHNEKCLKIIYVGRGGEEKRIHLIGKIATLCYKKNMPVEISFVGDVIHFIKEENRKYCKFYGELYDINDLSRIYKEADLILITSNREGFPMVIMEAMAYGVVPVSTNVGGIGYHIKNRMNGFLIENKSEEDIVKDMVEVIRMLIFDRNLIRQISLNAYIYACQHFGKERFTKSYRELFLSNFYGGY